MTYEQLFTLFTGLGGFAGFGAVMKLLAGRKRDAAEVKKVLAESEEIKARSTNAMLEAQVKLQQLQEVAIERVKAEADRYKAEADKHRSEADANRAQADYHRKLANEAQWHFEDCERQLKDLQTWKRGQIVTVADMELRIKGLTEMCIVLQEKANEIGAK